MDRAYLLEIARRSRGLTQAEVAARSGTSQATLSAYERGLKSPSLKVASRILEAIGFDLNLRVHIDWVEQEAPEAGRFWVPNLLWSVDMPHCFATLRVPDGDGAMREWDMRDREQRKGVYEQLILDGLPQQMIRWVDGPLLVDVWDELDLPDPVRAAWKRPIAIARERTRPDALRFGSEPMFTASAWIRSYETLPKKPRHPRVRFIRTRFDPRPLPTQMPRPAPPDDSDGER